MRSMRQEWGNVRYSRRIWCRPHTRGLRRRHRYVRLPARDKSGYRSLNLVLRRVTAEHRRYALAKDGVPLPIIKTLASWPPMRTPRKSSSTSSLVALAPIEYRIESARRIRTSCRGQSLFIRYSFQCSLQVTCSHALHFLIFSATALASSILKDCETDDQQGRTIALRLLRYVCRTP